MGTLLIDVISSFCMLRFWRRTFGALGALLLAVVFVNAQPATVPCPAAQRYGNDPKAGAFAQVNGIRLYYEIHGTGAPLLLIHGNGGSINGVRCQIAKFSSNRRVIIADSRSHGRSDDPVGRLTYEQMADDLAALLTHLKIETTDVWGHSDGGIVALLLASRHPVQVGKLVSSSANLRPDRTGLFAWFVERVRENSRQAGENIQDGDTSRDWARIKKQQDLMLEEPHITETELRKISAPTLLMFADSDIMPLEHAVEIYNAIPKAQLFVMPGSTHRVPSMKSEAYNAIVERFLAQPFERPIGGQQSPPRR